MPIDMNESCEKPTNEINARLPATGKEEPERRKSCFWREKNMGDKGSVCVCVTEGRERERERERERTPSLESLHLLLSPHPTPLRVFSISNSKVPDYYADTV